MGAVYVQAAGVGQESLSLEGSMVQGGLVQGKTVPGGQSMGRWTESPRISPRNFFGGFWKRCIPEGKAGNYLPQREERTSCSVY